MCFSNLIDKFWIKIGEKDKIRIENTKFIDGISAKYDIPYINDGNEYHNLDVYSPSDKVNEKLPIIIDIHGGGWYYGKKEINKAFNFILSKEGFHVVSGNYRLLRDYNFKDMFQDIFAQLKWIKNHAEEYHFDLNNIFIAGDSAGGHLAAMTISINSSTDLQKVFEVEPVDFKFNALALTCSVPNPSKYAKIPIANLYMKPCYGKEFRKCGFFNEADFSKNIPIDLPPVFINTCKKDPFCKDNDNLYKQLREMNYDAEIYLCTEKKENGKTIGHVYNIVDVDFEVSKRTNKRIAEFFKENLNK